MRPRTRAAHRALPAATGAPTPPPLTGPLRVPQVFDAFCKQRSVDAATMRFHLDGKRLRGTHTPAEVCFGLGRHPCALRRASPPPRPSQFDMQDDDSIDAFVEQVGGCALRVAAGSSA